MAEERSKSQKRKWKAVLLDDPSFFSGDLEGFGSLEVLEEYDLEKWKGGVNSGPTKKKRAKKDSDEV